MATSTSQADVQRHLLKLIKSEEVALNELKDLSSSRVVYQRHGNLFFRSTIQKATSSEEKQLDSLKTKLQKLNSS
ncbi:hypothetical protein Leryth_025417 [Lithospermum erythrorhizon]|nr:hypothetical protein Leryth_025417 [Lithospermum erythrorhizon]